MDAPEIDQEVFVRSSQPLMAGTFHTVTITDAVDTICLDRFGRQGKRQISCHMDEQRGKIFYSKRSFRSG